MYSLFLGQYIAAKAESIGARRTELRIGDKRESCWLRVPAGLGGRSRSEVRCACIIRSRSIQLSISGIQWASALYASVSRHVAARFKSINAARARRYASRYLGRHVGRVLIVPTAYILNPTFSF